MPTFFYTHPCISPKKLRLTAFLLLSPLLFHAQTLTGLWTGALSNDSTTVRKDQSFEIALTEYRGKVYGYSRSEFIVDDVLYFIVKRVKGTIEGNVCEVEDEEIIAYNFPGKLDKKVKVTSTFRRNQNDSTWYLDGTWKTNFTRKYYGITGKVALKEEKDLTASKIFPHLEELKLANEVAFYKERKEEPVIVRIVRPESSIVSSPVSVESKSITTPDIANTSKPISQTIFIETPDLTTTKSESSVFVKEEEKKTGITSKNDVAAVNTSLNSTVKQPVGKGPSAAKGLPNAQQSAISNKQITANNQSTVVSPQSTENNRQSAIANPQSVASNTKKTDEQVYPLGEDIPREKYVPRGNGQGATTNSTAKNDQSPTNNKNSTSNIQNSTSVVVVNVPTIKPNAAIEDNENWNEKVTLPPVPVVKTTLAERNGAAGDINIRKTEVSQVVNFKADSLELSLYDNGQVDGDTVSVLMNGEVILSKQGLKATAIKKTIYIPHGTNEEFTLVLYAENLGAYPPNTGLLVVHDGDDVYNLRFSSDFQKNAGIVFRRKK